MFLVELITLKLPYYNIIVIEVPNAILQEQLPQIEWEEESIYFKEVLLKCIEFDPKCRPKAEECIKYFLD